MSSVDRLAFAEELARRCRVLDMGGRERRIAISAAPLPALLIGLHGQPKSIRSLIIRILRVCRVGPISTRRMACHPSVVRSMIIGLS